MAGTEISEKRAELRRKGDEQKRAQIPVRTTARAKAALQLAADSNDRSLTQEIEQRLERSLEQETRHGGHATAALVARIVADIAEIEDATGKPWQKDNETFAAVRRAVIGVVLDSAPREVENNEEAVAALRRAIQAQKQLLLMRRMEQEGLPEIPEAHESTRASARKAIPKAEEDCASAMEAADKAYAPQRAAERRGRELHKRLTATRAALPRGLRSNTRGA